MFSSVLTFGIHGIDSFCVNVEADISDGMPVLELVGYLSGEVREAKERVRTALKNSGYKFPVKRITLNLSPGNIRKHGTGYDLPMAISILAAMEEISNELLKDVFIIGELMLNGDVGAVDGVLPMVIKARELGIKKCIVPNGNALEAKLVSDVEVIGVNNIKEAVRLLNGEHVEICQMAEKNRLELTENEVDLKYVKGQEYARYGLEVAAAGMHNLLMVGAPGAGKSMLAKCIPTILPDMTQEEALEVSAVYSVAGLLKSRNRLIDTRPFISPHHTVTDVAMTGGGTYPKPGNITLAHRGVLFLDEMAEFSRYSLEVLRQPLEERTITITRNQGIYTYPADFMLVGAMNPCPCGAYPDMSKCICTESARKRYVGRLSKPLLDRMDICVDVERMSYDKLLERSYAESSEAVRGRVVNAQKRQKERFKNDGILFNSQMRVKQIEKYCMLAPSTEEWFLQAMSRFDLSARSYHKILKVARTIADISTCEEINQEHLAKAIQLNNSYSML